MFTKLLPENFGDRLVVIEETAFRTSAHFPVGHDLFGDGSVLAVPLPGHADGHFGVLFDKLETPLLYATDTQWISEALAPKSRSQILPRLISDKFKDVASSSDLVFGFSQAGGTVILCHDDAPSPFDYAQGAVL